MKKNNIQNKCPNYPRAQYGGGVSPNRVVVWGRFVPYEPSICCYYVYYIRLSQNPVDKKWYISTGSVAVDKDLKKHIRRNLVNVEVDFPHKLWFYCWFYADNMRSPYGQFEKEDGWKKIFDKLSHTYKKGCAIHNTEFYTAPENVVGGKYTDL